MLNEEKRFLEGMNIPELPKEFEKSMEKIRGI